MAARVTLIRGGGVGYDQVPVVKSIIARAGVKIDWDEHLAGLAALEQGGAPLPAAMLASVKQTGLALKTKLLSTPESGNVNVRFRSELGLFVSVRPLRNIRGLPAHFDGVDIVVIRELTEDLYAAIEHVIVPGVVQSLKVVTEAASRRFFEFAFRWARQAGRKKVCCVHKANILKLADGLFLEAFRNTAKDFPEMETRELIVDNCCMQLVSRPRQFDVMVMGNLYGDLVSDLGAGVVGGISATAGINVGEKVRVYEAIHGGRSGEIGPGRGNPLPLLTPALYLLEDIGEKEAAARIRAAVEKVLIAGQHLTADLGGSATTESMGLAIEREVG
ncbi:MAG: isocitrate/isopropylmalate family dehydrogenase [Gemmataceae bacterium]